MMGYRLSQNAGIWIDFVILKLSAQFYAQQFIFTFLPLIRRLYLEKIRNAVTGANCEIKYAAGIIERRDVITPGIVAHAVIGAAAESMFILKIAEDEEFAEIFFTVHADAAVQRIPRSARYVEFADIAFLYAGEPRPHVGFYIPVTEKQLSSEPRVQIQDPGPVFRSGNRAQAVIRTKFMLIGRIDQLPRDIRIFL